MRLIMRSRVVLPQPDEPTKTVVLCAGMTRLKSSTARVPSGNSFVTPVNSIIVRNPINVDRFHTRHGRAVRFSRACMDSFRERGIVG